MPRPTKVWFRSDIGWWMVTLAGVKTRLIKGPDDAHHRQLAEEKFVELRKLERTQPHLPTARTADLIDAYLAWSRTHLSADTHRVNRYYGQSFAEHCGIVAARDIKPFHVTKWIHTMADPVRVEREKARRKAELEAGAVTRKDQGGEPRVWGESTAHNARVAAFRVFSWARDEGVLAENPLAGMKRPKPAARRRAMTEDEFQKLHAAAGGPFADYLFALRETGARPNEARELMWEHVRPDRWVLTKHKTSRKVHKDRVVILTDAMQAMMARLRGGGVGHVFLNTEGKPWTKNAVRLQMTRLREKLGLADDLTAYLARHGFGTRAILNGVNPAVVAELMGHSSLEMVAKVYVHLPGAHLKQAVEAISPATPARVSPGPVPKNSPPVNPKKSGLKAKA